MSKPYLLFIADKNSPTGETYIGMVHDYVELERKIALYAYLGTPMRYQPYDDFVRPEHQKGTEHAV